MEEDNPQGNRAKTKQRKRVSQNREKRRMNKLRKIDFRHHGGVPAILFF
jgi:hypothetical protein